MGSGRSELDWQAFQYVAGELTAEQELAFDERLANDQEAREAVAAAVALSEITAFVEQRPVEFVTPRATVVTPAAWARSLAWMGCGAAVCLLLVAIVQQSNTDYVTGNDPTGTVARRLPSGSPELALVWAQARNDISADEGTDLADSLLLDVDSGEIATPSWMVAAVAGLDEQVPDLE